MKTVIILFFACLSLHAAADGRKARAAAKREASAAECRRILKAEKAKKAPAYMANYGKTERKEARK